MPSSQQTPERNLAVAAAKKILASLPVLLLTGEAAIVFGALAARLRSDGEGVGELDEDSSLLDLPSPAHRPSAAPGQKRPEGGSLKYTYIHR